MQISKDYHEQQNCEIKKFIHRHLNFNFANKLKKIANSFDSLLLHISRFRIHLREMFKEKEKDIQIDRGYSRNINEEGGQSFMIIEMNHEE